MITHTLILPDVSSDHDFSLFCQNDTGFKATSFIRWSLCGVGTSIVPCINTCAGLVQHLQLGEVKAIDIVSRGIEAGGIVKQLLDLWSEFSFSLRIQKLPFFMT